MARRTNPRAAQQRATAKAVRERRTQLPKSTTGRARLAPHLYIEGVANGTIAEPAKGSPESKLLARAASLSYHHKADPAYLAAFQQYFYHDDKKTEAAIEEEEYDEDEEE